MPSNVLSKNAFKKYLKMCWRPCLISGKSPYKELLPLHVLWDQRQCDVAGHTDEQANMRERSRCDVRAHRVVCRESTPGSHHHHQHQELSRDVFPIVPCCISYHVKYKYSNNYVSLLFSKEGYAGSTNIVGFHILSHSFLHG